MKSIEAAPGISVLDASEVGLRILCGCPENCIKYLMRSGLVSPTEKDGVRFETGPNAVLLSEAPLRGGKFRNAVEFPILHMLYKQGMIIPGHPNNDGGRPLIIGMPRCVDELAEYVYLGNYGITERNDLVGGGVDGETADLMLRIKRLFSFGRFKSADELLELMRLEAPITEIRKGLFIRREAPDRYEFILGGESVRVDLSRPEDEELGAPYVLPRGEPSRERFAVTHIGEGDGWDPTRPCMGSLLSAGGGLWLIDAGPNIEYSLEALGLSLSDIEGVFNSHVHDDHFLGLASLFRGERKLRYCAVPCVRRAAARKLAALARIDEEEFGQYFEVRDLVAGEWNDFGDFQVQAIIAPHPVENTLFRFRAAGPEGPKTYAHWADLTSFAVLDSMRAEKRGDAGLDAATVEKIRSTYLEPATLKKLDVGGGMIHGDAKDYAGDRSETLLLSHTSAPTADTAFARVASFGASDVLIAGRPPAAKGHPAEMRKAPPPGLPVFRFLEGISTADAILADAEEKRFAAGQILDDGFVYFIVSGSVRISAMGKSVETVGVGNVVGLASLALMHDGVLALKAAAETAALRVAPGSIDNIPALRWRARELYARRLIAAERDQNFDWHPAYDIGISEIDQGHKKLFACIEELCESESETERASCRDTLRCAMEEHFGTEERLMADIGYPWLREHRRLHEKLCEEFTGEKAEAEIEARIAALKDCFVRHTLIADRRYLPWVK